MRPTRPQRLSTLILPALLSLQAGRALAQTSATGQAPPRPASAQTEEERAAAEARKRQAVEGGGVTYEQVLADPDNVELNYRYALTQVDKGDLKGAAATLERVLMVKPNLPRVRLVYAVVLFRLDNIDDAEREIGLLKKYDMPGSLRAELEDIERQIRARRRRTVFGGNLGLGFDYDSNRNASPASGQRLFAAVPFNVTGTGERQSDTAIVVLAGVGAVHDLGTQAGHKLFANLNHFRAEQTVMDNLDLTAYSGQVGGVYKTPWLDATPTFQFDHVRLSEETFLRTRRLALRLDRQFSSRLEGWLEGAHAYNDYGRTSDVPVGEEREGVTVDGTLGARYRLIPAMNVFGSYTYSEVGAEKLYNAYLRQSITLGHTWLLGRGRFLLSTLTMSYDRYDKPDTVISPTTREDDSYRLRFTFGTPLGFVAKPLKDLLFTFTYEYYHALSTITNYAYTNNKASTLLNYRWEL